jgi:quinohemoprotein ethanol dehydrogenase
MHCFACHGLNLVGAGSPAPDLRESSIAASEDSLWSVLQTGALLSRGMPRFEELTREQVHQLYAYIRNQARVALGSSTQKTR